MIQGIERVITKLNPNGQCELAPISRYGIMIDDMSMRTAYFFSSPIYCTDMKQRVSMIFDDVSIETFILKGTNSTTKVDSQGFCFKNANNAVRVEMDLRGLKKHSNSQLLADRCRIFPTTNGVAISCKVKEGQPVILRVVSSCIEFPIKSSSKSFSIMEERHTPLFSLCALYAADGAGKKHPLLLKGNTENGISTIIIDSPEIAAEEIFFEMNMYEHKLIQDTTVEINRPQENNAFGGAAFLGASKTFGEQWLYMKPDYSLLADINSTTIRGAKIYVPNYQSEGLSLDAYAMETRFCSFGSNWDNKVSPGRNILNVRMVGDYCCVDLTKIMVDKNGRLKFSNGFLLKARNASGQYCILATGDSCFNPPILEVKYEK